MLLGLLGYYGASLSDFLGLQYISAGLERLILLTYWILDEPISAAQIAGTLLVLAGVLLVTRKQGGAN